MKLRATYADGRLEFDQSVQFARPRFIVFVDVPDQEFVRPKASDQTAATSDPEPATQTEMAASGISLPAEADQWLARLEALRADAIAGQGDQSETLSEVQRQRLHAFAMREDR